MHQTHAASATRRLGLLLGLCLLAGCEDLPPEAAPPVVAVASASPAPTPSAVLPRPTPASAAPSARPSATPTPAPSGVLVVAGNLDARVPMQAPETPEGPLNYVDVPAAIADDRGTGHCGVVRFTHTEANTWAWQVYMPDATAIFANPESPPAELRFDGSPRESGALDFVWARPSGEQAGATVRLDWSGVTQEAGPTSLKQEGATSPCPP